MSGGKSILSEIKRGLNGFYNYVEPPRIGTVTKVHGGLVDVKVEDIEFILDDVPCVNCNPTKGDKVLVTFISGHIGNPVVIGRF